MNNLWKNILLFILSLSILLVGFSAFAIPAACNGSYCNPLGNVNQILPLIKKILGYLVQITFPLAVLAIIISGLMYLVSSVSNPSKAAEAKKIFGRVLIGVVFVVGALALAEAVVTFLQTLSQ